MQFGYNEYMAHHYAYMTHVAEVRELECYVDASNDANWHAAMEEEMHALAENETWDLVYAPKCVKPIGCRWVYKVKYKVKPIGCRWVCLIRIRSINRGPSGKEGSRGGANTAIAMELTRVV